MGVDIGSCGSWICNLEEGKPGLNLGRIGVKKIGFFVGMEIRESPPPSGVARPPRRGLAGQVTVLS